MTYDATSSFMLGLILARRGSQRLENKNGRSFAGTSLLDLSVRHAFASRLLNHIGLSTDAEEYLSIAKEHGLHEEYVRPEHLSGAEASSAACVIDYVDWLDMAGPNRVTHVVLLQPTSPFRTAEQIDLAIEKWQRSGRASLVSITPVTDKPKTIVAPKNGKLARPFPNADDECYVLDGAIFITPLEMLRERNCFWDENSEILINSHPCLFDIDTIADFTAAEAVFDATVNG